MNSCRLCGADGLLQLIDFGEHPIAHRFLLDPSDKEYVHPVIACLCERCGLIQLEDPIPPDELYTAYNWLSSWKWNPHVPRLVDLVERFSPDSKKASRIVEVGSNDGSFLESLRKRGFIDLLGVEPAEDAREAGRQRNLDIVGAYFTPATAQAIVETHGKCDFFVSRQMLEHVGGLRQFAEAMHILIRPGGYVLFEVPNFAFSLGALDYSGIWEEHVNYFTLESLGHFLSEAGVQILHNETAIFSGEALFVIGQYHGRPEPPPLEGCAHEVRMKALRFRDQWPKFRSALIEYLENHLKSGGRAGIYGAGCRASSLINFAGLGPYLSFCLDDQHEKQGKFMPGSHLPVLAGEELEKMAIDVCLLAVNAENEDTVIAKHQTFESRGGRFYSLHPPSPRLLPLWGHF